MMSLRSIHVAFIVASIALALMVTVWGAGMYMTDSGGVGHLAFGVGALLSGVGMTAYLTVFIRKTRRIGMQ